MTSASSRATPAVGTSWTRPTSSALFMIWSSRKIDRREVPAPARSMSPIGWWCKSNDLPRASVRLRAYLVMRALRDLGIDAEWYDPKQPHKYEVVVVARRYDDKSYSRLSELKRRGTTIVVDLCDNHFFNPNLLPQFERRRGRLMRLLRIADKVVVSTATLRDAVSQEMPEVLDVAVIGDLMDRLDVVPVSPIRKLAAKFRWGRLRGKIERLRSAGYVGLVWFGNHGVRYAEGGMRDLVPHRSRLEALARQRSIYLTVISNNEKTFQESVATWSIPTFYLKWDPIDFAAQLRMHEISLIPVKQNDFTRCKTDNRVVTALSHGLAVVADRIPSYEPYGDAIVLDDWDRGLSRYLADEEHRAADVKAGQEIVRRSTDSGQIAARWRAVLQPAGTPAPQQDSGCSAKS